MSSIKNITDEPTFHSYVASLPSTTLAVIAFHTPWAAPCKQMHLVLETLASSYPPQSPPIISFLSLDAEALPEISESYDVTAVPFLVLQRDGKVLESSSGGEASKVRDTVERHAGKGGNTGKLGLPPALEVVPAENSEDKGQQTEKTKNLSSYAPDGDDAATAPEMSSTQSQKEELDQRLGELVKAAPVMLFMKGTPSTPQCGFSRQLVGLLREKGVRYGFFNILADEEVRQGLKAWSDWPTFPQLYLKGELVGGLDIVKEELNSDPDFFSEFQAAPKGQGALMRKDGVHEYVGPPCSNFCGGNAANIEDPVERFKAMRVYQTKRLLSAVTGRDDAVTHLRVHGWMSGGGEYLKDEGSRLQTVAAGAIAGLVSRSCIAPLDVLKIRLQLQIHSVSDPFSSRHSERAARYGISDTFRNIIRDEGITALWKGNVAASFLYISYGAVQFSVYRAITTIIHPLNLQNEVEAFISGAVAGASATTLSYPLDLLRTRFAAQGRDRVYASLRGSIRDILHEEGPKGFFQGLGAGVGQVVPYMGLFFSAYEALRSPLASLSLPFGSGDATAGVLASVLAKTGVFPLDLIRKRLQVQGPTRARYAGGTIPVYGQGLWRTGKSIVTREGLRGLYRGLGVGLVKSAPASAITMWTYERALKVFKEIDKPVGKVI